MKRSPRLPLRDDEGVTRLRSEVGARALDWRLLLLFLLGVIEPERESKQDSSDCVLVFIV